MIGESLNTHESQFGEQGEWLARQFFSPTDLQMSPEEYAARVRTTGAVFRSTNIAITTPFWVHGSGAWAKSFRPRGKSSVADGKSSNPKSSRRFSGKPLRASDADDVIDLASEECTIFMDEAVFAQPLGSKNHQTSQVGRNIRQAHGVRCRRARALANRMRCSS